MAFEFASVAYSLRGISVCRFLISTNQHSGGVSTVAGDQGIVVDPMADTDQLRDSGAIARDVAEGYVTKT